MKTTRKNTSNQGEREKQANIIAEKVLNAIPEGALYGDIYNGLISVIAMFLTDIDDDSNPLDIITNTLHVNNMLLGVVNDIIKEKYDHEDRECN